MLASTQISSLTSQHVYIGAGNRCFTSNFVYIGGGKQSQEMRDL